MKTHTNPTTERPAGFRALMAAPAWVKIRRFFWAVGVVLWNDVILFLIFPRETFLAKKIASEMEQKNQTK